MALLQGTVRVLAAFSAGVGLLGGALSCASAADTPADVSELCVAAAEAEERTLEIPHALLQSLSLAESGRRDEETKRLVAWPWTVMAAGEGRFYPSKEAAVVEVQRLQAQGVRNIDVGCMQINLMHHATAFDSIELALDPETNVAYGARYLAALKRETGSWFTAVKRYHSAAPQHHLPYRMRVFQIWRNTKRQMIADAEKPVIDMAKTSEAMSATISFWSMKLANLPIVTTPESRETRWRDAFSQTEAALAEWRKITVSRPGGAYRDIDIAAGRARAALRVLDRASPSGAAR